MTIAHVTQTGNISIPKSWREELGIEPDSEVIIEIVEDKIVIEPLKRGSLKDSFRSIDDEVKRKRITFSRAEAVRDDLYD